MNYDVKTKRLTINFSKDDYQPETLLVHKDVNSIYLDEYSHQIELPVELGTFINLSSLLIWGADTKASYEPPVNLEKLNNIRTLTFRNPAELSTLSPMPNVECLDICIQDPYVDIPVIASVFSNIKVLKLRGHHIEEGQLHADIARFSQLEHLLIDSCGLTDLPLEIKQLTSLKSITMFRMSGTIMDVFPSVLCDLVGLEKLVFAHKIKTLPESFSNLKALKYLNLSNTFNNGTDTPIANSIYSVVNIKPIPEVIGRLPALETLKLSNCGVIDVSSLTGLSTLKKLKIGASGIPDCQGFSAFVNLEELNLQYAAALCDIDGLRGLPLKKLYLESCDELKSITGLDDLNQLEELNIDYCRRIKDLDPIYNHSSLQQLEADNEIVEHWKQKEKYQQLPSIDTVIQGISSADIKVFSQAVGHLKSYVDKNYHDDINPLAGYFSCEEDDHQIVHLSILETGFEKHKGQLEASVLIDLVDLSYHLAGDDNYMITLWAIGEINRRKDSEAQSAVIALFNNACKRYDAGHRYWETTVLDQLIEHYFVAFSTRALTELLSHASSDLLNNEGGDGLDTLFISAFKRCQSNDECSTLIEVFFNYQDRSIEYLGLEYFVAHQNTIMAILGSQKQALFQRQLDARSFVQKLQTLLESGNAENIIKLIRLFGNDMPDDFFEANDARIIRRANELDLPDNDISVLLDFYLKQQTCSKLIAETLFKYVQPKGAEKVIQCLQSAEINNGYFLEKILLHIMLQLNMNNVSVDDIQPFRTYLKSIKNYTQDEIYTLEVKALFLFVSKHRQRDNLVHCIDRVEALVSLVAEQFDTSGMDLLSNLWSIARDKQSHDYEIVKRLTQIFFRVIPKRIIVNVLFLAVISAVETNDEAWFNKLVIYIPAKVHKDLLAYNLACGFAKFNHKNEALKYIRIALELGKTTTQFLNDDDFSAYKDEPDFLNLLQEYE